MSDIFIPKAEQLHGGEKFLQAIQIAGECALWACQGVSVWGGIPASTVRPLQSKRQLLELEFAKVETCLANPLERTRFEYEGIVD